MKLQNQVRRRLLPIYQQAQRRLHDLRFLFFEVTNRCNLECLHCGSDCRKDSEQPDLSPESITRVLKEVRAKYDPHKITVVLTGGEPICYPNLFDLGREIHKLEFPWGLVTNGHAWSRDMIDEALAAGLGSITVSLDGFAAEHDWLRGRTGTFCRATETIKMLTQASAQPTMDVVTCANQRNLATLPRFASFLEELGVERWRLFTVSPIGRASGQDELHLRRDEFLQMLEIIRAIRRESRIHLSLSESGYMGHDLAAEVRDVPYFCRAGINVAGIMVNGDILACPNIDRRFRQGNIATDSFVDVWKHGYTIFRDRSWMRQGQCSGCREWDACQGNSFHLWDRDNDRTRLCHFKEYGQGTGRDPS